MGSGNITYKPGGETILKAMNAIGYDAMTVGNREFHFSRMGFQSKVRLAHFPVLCANIRLSGQSLPDVKPVELPLEDLFFSATGPKSADGKSTQPQHDPPTSRCILKTLTEGEKTFRVVIFGLTVPMITARMAVRHASPYVFDDPLVTATRLVPLLRETYRPDLLVALSDIGISQDRKLAEMVPGIDLIIGGHTHVVLAEGERVGNTLLVQAGSHGRYWGHVNIVPALNSSSRSQLSSSLLPLPKTPNEAQAQIQSLRETDVPIFTPEFTSKSPSGAENL